MTRPLLGAIGAAVCFAPAVAQDWQGFVYPTTDDLTIDAELGTFETLENCRETVQRILDLAGWRYSGSYECGYKCRPPSNDFGLWVCERTEQ